MKMFFWALLLVAVLVVIFYIGAADFSKKRWCRHCLELEEPGVLSHDEWMVSQDKNGDYFYGPGRVGGWAPRPRRRHFGRAADSVLYGPRGHGRNWPLGREDREVRGMNGYLYKEPKW